MNTLGAKPSMLFCVVFFLFALQFLSVASKGDESLSLPYSQDELLNNHDIHRTVSQPKDELASYEYRSSAPVASAGRATFLTSRSSEAKGNFVADHGVAITDNVVLGNIVLISTIEGGIYGLSRETGDRIWTLPPQASSNSTERDLFAPLVGSTFGPAGRTFSQLVTDVTPVDKLQEQNSNRDQTTLVDGGQSALEATQNFGLYIVEPSNGNIYILTRPLDGSSPTKLSKLPLSLPQLVDLGPFSFPGDISRVFAGHKRTSLVEIDVLTGRIGGVFGGEGASHDALWCPAEAKSDNKPGLDQHEDFCERREQWTHIGRTDYTLTIHLRGQPWLSQTLRYSTFTPDIAHRNLATTWSQRVTTLDQRALLAMPEEGTVVCFNASTAFKTSTSDKRNREQSIWVTELGATVAGIYDIIHPDTSSNWESQEGTRSQAVGKAVIVPHPRAALPNLFSSLSTTNQDPQSESFEKVKDDGEELITYLGLSGGHLYAMGQREYPLIALAPQAPVALSQGPQHREGRRLHEKHRQQGGDTGRQTSCSSSSCFVGTYALVKGGRGGSSDFFLPSGSRMLVGGKVPPLGISDGSDDHPSSITDNGDMPNDTSQERQTDYEQTSPSSPSPSRKPWSALPSPTMLLAQMIVVLLLAVLCGLVYVGAQEQRRQNAEQAIVASKELSWTPDPTKSWHVEADSREETKAKADQELVDRTTPASEGKISMNSEQNPLDFDAELVLGDKKKAAKRRRRGKRAGNAVQQREDRRENTEQAKGKADELEDRSDDGEDLRASDVHLDERSRANASISSPSPTTLAISKAGWMDITEETRSKEGADAMKIAASPSLSAKGGKTMEAEEGVMAKGGKSLVISDDVLGYGSSGTIVFRGTFQGRAVAVKRLLRDFVDVASKEVSLLESADNHPNVIRYFYKEVTSTFLFIALELCPASLADIIERPAEWQELCALLQPKRCLWQIASGVHHLHSLSIVHRDIKPQNILVTYSPAGKLKMLLSDFGLSKRLEGIAQTSFSQTMNSPGGTVGWRAPEILRGDVSLDEPVDGSSSSTMTDSASDAMNTSADHPNTSLARARLTRAVDIFALGCLTYYVLSNGEHPFGSRYEREVNIIRNCIDLRRLDSLGEEGHEAQHVVLKMVEMDPKDRLTAHQVMAHPYFWNSSRRLAFLQDASDKLDNMEREPPAPALVSIEENSVDVLGGADWLRKIDRQVLEDLNKRRKYDGRRVVDLLRAIRNKKHHIHDLSPQLRRLFGTTSDSFLAYFTLRFPKLFLHTYSVVQSSTWLKSDPAFAPYFQPVETDP